ncbi:hypothetical protein ACFTZ8_25105 [Streptomyces fungicidicus]|jgi:hypothetical protein|uniref:Secreted protein n=2 Tax=Streptomyces TaxID=1883 RepID=A0A494UM02_9ACTN|nr:MULTISPECIES: hypothetical protein [Streptomyces]AYL35580.1 hypothetical protein CNQ36_09110 [Streptomyces fungicidicus]EFL41866.1 hypothetical protein SSRG_04670 [Streptomyces griseoflavus Tu4000]QKV99969.1 hypothetical protein HUT14_08875 [Streptomyces sp. NA02536]TQL23046.1 hypothetical protein FBY37_5100 [Streptomyces sp. SLBN-134]
MNLRSILTVAAATAAGSALMIAPAHASTGNPAPATDTGIQARVECTSLSNGQLCISLNVDPSSISVFYTKTGGSTISANLGFRNSAGTTTWGSTKSISVNERANSTWTMSYPCTRDYKGLIKVSGQGTFETPWATC